MRRNVGLITQFTTVIYVHRITPHPFPAAFTPISCVENSYYLADGVKLFSQETWRLFMGEAGREMVGKYAQDVTDYYCMASELDNHCVRESACHSIAEMAEKVLVSTAELLCTFAPYAQFNQQAGI